MEYINFNDIETNFTNGLSLTIGNFDGIHRGHKVLIDKIIEKSMQNGFNSALMTLDQCPIHFFKDKNIPHTITHIAEKKFLLKKTNLDLLILLNFAKVSKMSPQKFVEDIIIKKLNVKSLIIGYDFHFGKDRKGNAEFLKKYNNDFEVEVIEPFKDIDHDIISSTLIRQKLETGDINYANKLLGHEYLLIRKIVRGHQLGKSKLGYPTANLEIISGCIYPKNGVYLVKITIKKQKFWGVANIGVKPTIDQNLKQSIEVHIFDFDDDIYDQEIMVSFCEFLRPEQKFNSLEELKYAIKNDCEDAKKLIKEKKLL